MSDLLERMIAQLNEHSQRLARLEQADPPTPQCAVTATATISVPNTTNVPITWATSALNVSGMFDIASPTILTVSIPGTYIITGAIAWDGISTAGLRIVEIHVNGSAVRRANSDSISVTWRHLQTISNILPLAAGDYIELIAAQTSGTTITITPTSYSPWLSAVLIG